MTIYVVMMDDLPIAAYRSNFKAQSFMDLRKAEWYTVYGKDLVFKVEPVQLKDANG